MCLVPNLYPDWNPKEIKTPAPILKKPSVSGLRFLKEKKDSQTELEINTL